MKHFSAVGMDAIKIMGIYEYFIETFVIIRDCIDKFISSPNTLFLSEIFNPKAKRIFRLVSILHGIPFSIRLMVTGDMLAFLESSALLIRRDSLIFFKEFFLIFWTLRKVWV